MARQGNRLAALQLTKLTKKRGAYADGHGLYLMVRRPGDASWTFRYRWNNGRFDLGLGPLHTVSLAEARNRAAEARKLILDGKDPLAVKREAAAAAQIEAARTLTFEQAARQFLETDNIQKLKDQASWVRTLGYLYPTIGNLPLEQIDSAIVLQALLPVVKKTGETGTRLRGRVERVFAWAKAHKLFTGENPASRDVLRDALPAKPKAKHHKALPYAELPGFMDLLRCRDSVSSLALQFTFLTAARTAETIGARWSEIDMKAATWTIPGDRMKAGKAHTVPLSDMALTILRGIGKSRHHGGDHIFINGGGLPLSNMAMAELLKSVPGVSCTVHGFRSTFMDWCHDRTTHAKHVIDMALAHSIGDKTEAAYRRGDLLAKRVQLMQQWADYCNGDATVADGDNVVPIRA